MKLYTKTAILLFSGFFVLISLFSTVVYLTLADYTHDDFNRLLNIRVVNSAKEKLDGEITQEQEAFKSDYLEGLPGEKKYFYSLKDSINFVKEASKIKIPSSFFNTILEKGAAEYNSNGIYHSGIRYVSKEGPYIVVVSAENYFEQHQTTYLRNTMLVSILVAIVISFFVAFFYSKMLFKPIQKITSNVKQISSENLHLRLNIHTGIKELKELADTFNFMLDRIETSFEIQNNFISNASHELRTPLTAIIGESDVALSKVRKPEEYIETIKIIMEEAEKLEKKTTALLFLAQTGFNGSNPNFSKVRIDQLIFDVKETMDRINAKNKIHVDLSLLPENPKMLKVLGNEQLLHLALTNIISNACKYSNNRLVNVSIGASNNQVILVVMDAGVGIPQEEIKFIYDPFFRASNVKEYEGYGIGLPLTQNIIRLHKGEMKVTSIVGQGTVVEIRMPIGKFDSENWERL